MAVLTVSAVSRTGVNLTDDDVAAASGGDSFANTGKEALYVLNGSGGAITVTIVVQATPDGLDVTDRTVSVPAGKAMLIGPFQSGIYNDANGRVQLTYSGVTSLTVLPVQLTAV